MLRKQIEHFITISLRFFFDLDYAMFHHAFLTILIVAGLGRLFMSKLIEAFQDSAKTVKQDYLTFRELVAELRTRWINSELRAFFTTHAHQVWQNISGFGFRIWWIK